MVETSPQINIVLAPDAAVVDPLKHLETPDIHDVSVQLESAREAYLRLSRPGDPPQRMELIAWYIHGLCSYFVHAVLIPVIFPLIIAQITSPTSTFLPSIPISPCYQDEASLYQRLIRRTISLGGAKLSALHWTAISWAAGVFVAGPILTFVARHLDHGRLHAVILVLSTTVGATICLLTGFFKTVWIFPLYIVVIATAHTVAAAAHGRHLGLMVRGLTAGKKHLERGSVSGWLSLYATAAGTAGAAVFTAFTYHMLRRSDQHTSLWVVSIFSGLVWAVSVCDAWVPATSSTMTGVPSWSHALQIYKHPHAVGGLVGVSLSSFASMCIFTSGTIHVVGQLCVKPAVFLSLWLLYFSFPVVSLPFMHPVQLALRADAVRMQLLGFFLSAAAAGTGFYYRGEEWGWTQILVGTLFQSTGAGVLQAFGRVLLLDCSPEGKEGAFSAWLEWVKATGACAGFGLAVARPGDVRATFGLSFVAAVGGMVALIFGNVSSRGGRLGAGHVVVKEGREESHGGSPGLDSIGQGREGM